jgi:outer membrane protein
MGVLATPGGAGLGAAIRGERSMYRGAGVRNDLLPLYMYDGKHLYLHAYRFGL